MMLRVHLALIILWAFVAIASFIGMYAVAIQIKVDGEWVPLVPFLTTWHMVGAFALASVGAVTHLKFYSFHWKKRMASAKADEARIVNDQIMLSR